VCFEANKNLSDFLKEKYINTNVIVDNRGLSNDVGIKKFNISNANTISTFSEDWIKNSRFSNDYLWEEFIDVETTTLDKVIDYYGVPDLVKIDVEGYEYEVLIGLTKLLDDTLFSFEWAEEQYEKIKMTVDHLMEIGYENFAYTYGDDIKLNNQITWAKWDELDMHQDISPERKSKWGMIYFKK
jgi:FkbM family methyltransferase